MHGYKKKKSLPAGFLKFSHVRGNQQLIFHGLLNCSMTANGTTIHPKTKDTAEKRNMGKLQGYQLHQLLN